tara:strand:+ start:203 stop:496 length:294 start_codon:yes stop_codon:yes gene_type:complete
MLNTKENTMNKYQMKKIKNDHFVFGINPTEEGVFKNYYLLKLETTWANYPYVKSKVHRIYSYQKDELEQVKIINNLDNMLPIEKIVDVLYQIQKGTS